MAENGDNSRSRKYTKLARQLAAGGCYAKAYDMYISAFNKFPDLKTSLEAEFRLLLSKLNALLFETNKIAEIFFYFEHTLAVYPDNIYILNDLGKYLYKFGFYKEACTHFQRALAIDSGYVGAEKNLNSVKNFLVDRWHFRMLNDKTRNEAYRKAIKAVLKHKKDSIIDIGTGTGLLSIYASECEPVAITAIDSNEYMASIASEILKENNINGIVLVPKLSTKLQQQDIGGKKSLIINELYDAGLFGEGVLQTLIHAWENLITNDGHIIPGKAEFYVAGAKCSCLNMKYQLSLPAKQALNITKYKVHSNRGLNEPYDCDDVHMIKGLTYMTEPKSIIKVDFSCVESMKEILYRELPFEVLLRAKERGEIDVLVGWFNLYLTENITITTNPTSHNRANAWQQAIFCDFIPREVEKNEDIPVKFSCTEGKLTLLQDAKLDIRRITDEMLHFLNDACYMKMIQECIGAVCIYLGQTAEISNIAVVDLSPFPVIGMLMMKRGACSLICQAKTTEDRKFIRSVFSINKVPRAKVRVIIEDKLNHKAFKDQKFNLIVGNILELGGDLNTDRKELTNQLQKTNLLPGGLFLPFKIELHAQIINSHWLDVNNCVYDENVSEYKVGMYMNRYQVSQNFHINISQLQYNPISESTLVAVVSDEMRSEVINVPIINNGYANGIICWYTIQLIETGTIISTNRANSFIDAIAFLANPKMPMLRGQIANILSCVDVDSNFKLVIDTDA
ncbi:hypothetical protein JYU34_011109 [Plutella xylostella]|uniref:Protein arginine N-methyltransferase domain-containing protein n=1 Tax=Plutella xylostella TaxID=51655 RepID=A0ABQ7QGV8_PLUXY|nr:hypothetical protein JYU34_011109 [Plutella xylostella]